MEKVITKDGSITFYSKKFKEHYHSTSGALEEAFEKFCKPCKKFIKKNKVKILDICFGIGYNSLAAILEFKNVEIAALENDKEILKEILNLDICKEYGIIKKVAKDFSYKDKNVKVELILGDARKSIKNLDTKFDIVFLDPFSMKKCPELWSYEFLKDVKNKMNSDGVLTTYSCASLFRTNLKSLGFLVKDGPSIGRRAPSTIAVLI